MLDPIEFLKQKIKDSQTAVREKEIHASGFLRQAEVLNGEIAVDKAVVAQLIQAVEEYERSSAGSNPRLTPSRSAKVSTKGGANWEGQTKSRVKEIIESFQGGEFLSSAIIKKLEGEFVAGGITKGSIGTALYDLRKQGWIVQVGDVKPHVYRQKISPITPALDSPEGEGL